MMFSILMIFFAIAASLSFLHRKKTHQERSLVRVGKRSPPASQTGRHLIWVLSLSSAVTASTLLSGCKVGKFSAVDDMGANAEALKDPKSPEPVSPVPSRPVIESLLADPATIASGQQTTLRFQTQFATSLRLNPGNVDVTGTSTKLVSPSASTTYTLTATNPMGTTTKTVSVTVTSTPPPPDGERPVISSFTASPTSIASGESSTLRFTVANATSLRIEPGALVVTGSTSTVVRPTANTTYTLTATNAAGSTTQTTSVTVTAAPPPPVSGGGDCVKPDFTPLTKEARGPVKFFPGHYVHVTTGGGSKNILETLPEIKDLPNVPGILKRYGWSDIETDKDVYDFTKIQTDLDAVHALGKKLVVMIMYKYKNLKGQNIVPSYLSKMGDGESYFTLKGEPPHPAGYLPRFDKTFVVERFIALMNALKRFDSHPALAAIVFPETALSVNGLTTDTQDEYFKGLMRVDKSSACLFKQTPVIQLTNFPFRLIRWMTENYKKYAVSMGGPDVLLDDPDLAGPGKAYSFYPSVAGTVPIGVIVATSNYMYNNVKDFASRTKNGLSPADSIKQLAAFAHDRLKSNYIFWKKDWSGDDYYKAFLAAAKARTLPELERTCPSVYVCR